jgi:hypothetical protein
VIGFGDYIEIDINSDRTSLLYGELIRIYNKDSYRVVDIAIHMKKEIGKDVEFVDTQLLYDYYLTNKAIVRVVRENKCGEEIEEYYESSLRAKFIDMALQTKDEEWFMELTNKSK